MNLKQFLAYLPYNLEFRLPLNSDRYESIIEDEPWRLCFTFPEAIEKGLAYDFEKMKVYQLEPSFSIIDNRIFLGQMMTSLAFDLDDVYLDELIPILRPMSELNKVINHNGEEFIPMDYLKNKFPNLDMNQPTYDVMNHLLEWHFDVFDINKNYE